MINASPSESGVGRRKVKLVSESGASEIVVACPLVGSGTLRPSFYVA